MKKSARFKEGEKILIKAVVSAVSKKGEILCVQIPFYRSMGIDCKFISDICDSQFVKIENDKRTVPDGTPTDTKDIAGRTICIGDVVDRDFPKDTPSPFEVVFEENAVRKKYKRWKKDLPKPILETGNAAKGMRFKIVEKYYDKL